METKKSTTATATTTATPTNSTSTNTSASTSTSTRTSTTSGRVKSLHSALSHSRGSVSAWKRCLRVKS